MLKNIIFIILFTTLTLYTQEQFDYRITSQLALIKLNPESKKVEIIDTLKIIFNKEQNNLKLILNPLFDSVKVTYNDKKLKSERIGEKLYINGNFKKETNIVLSYSAIFYHRTEFSKIDDNSIILRENDILPLGTKSYEYIRFTIQTPLNWKAIALGEKKIEQVYHNFKTFVFENTEKVETIGWICAGNYFVYEDTFENIQLNFYSTQNRSKYSKAIFDVIKNSLKFYSSLFIPYRFKKLSVIEVENWLAGNAVLAAAYPSVILVKQKTFDTTDAFNNILNILPHEIAHQWWPLTNFLQDTDYAFLSEGLCEYSAILYKESINEKNNLNNHPLLRSLLIKSQKGKDFPLNKKIDLRTMPTHYLKASYVHNMLRFVIGDSNYKLLLKEYSKKHSLNVTTTKTFIALAETISGKNLKYFYQQWIENTGVPRFKIYGVKTKSLDTTYLTSGRVRMIGYESNFSTPIELGIKSNNNILKQTLYLGYDKTGKFKNEAEFIFQTVKKPEKIILDPDGVILKWQKMPAKFSDLRDPSNGVMIIGTNCNSERLNQLLNLARLDSTEMEKAGWSLKIINDHEATLIHLQSGNVFIYGNYHENNILDQCLKYFPYKLENDFIELNGKIYSDSLSFIQIIDNPFASYGSMCWIVPFNLKSEPVLLPYEASYLVLDRSNIILKGEWQIENQDLIVEIK